MADESAVPVVDGSGVEPVLSNWEFLDRIPEEEEVRALLATLRPVWGVKTSDYYDYVQALPQSKKVKVPHPTNPKLETEEYVDAYTIYMSVAGRIKMLEEAAETHEWVVDFEPEPRSAGDLPPGYLAWDPRLVYREYVKIERLEPFGSRVGRKGGTAWVPFSGGKQAAASNPFEKVETSARGRALGAWGFGVLPGSGIASVEEMRGVSENLAYARAAGVAPGEPVQRRSSDELLQEALALMETVRQQRGQSEEEMLAKAGDFLQDRLGIKKVFDPETKIIDWSKVKDGQLMLLSNSLKDALAAIAEARSSI